MYVYIYIHIYTHTHNTHVSSVPQVAAMAEAKGLSAAQLSLAWLCQKAKRLNVVCVPIPGTTKAAHALSNLAAADAPELSDAEMAQLEELGASCAGERGDEAYCEHGIEGVAARSV